MPDTFQTLETLLERAFLYWQQLLFRVFFYLLNRCKHFPFIGVFSFQKKKKSAWAKVGEYGGWGMITVLFLAKNLSTNIEVCVGALS